MTRKVSFRQLSENMSLEHSRSIDTKSMKAIRKGISASETFWDDFLQVCNNSDAVADLLGVRPDQVTGWSSRIKENLDRVYKADDRGDDTATKNKVLDTGTNVGNEAI